MLEEKRNFNTRNDGEIVSFDDLVPRFHLLRKIDKSIDWKKIYPIVEGKYGKIGRPSVDPVVLVKNGNAPTYIRNKVIKTNSSRNRG